MTGYEETIRHLGDNSEKILLQLWAAVERGDLPSADFPEVASQILAVANERGRAAAELALNGYLTAATGVVQAPRVLPLVDDRARLLKAFGTILATEQGTAMVLANEDGMAMRLARIAVAEPLEAAVRRFSEGISQHPKVTGWVRQLEPDACQLCVWWWREGRIWPKDHPFQHHKGCTCNPLPTMVSTEHDISTAYTRKLERAKAAAETKEYYAAEVAKRTTEINDRKSA